MNLRHASNVFVFKNAMKINVFKIYNWKEVILDLYTNTPEKMATDFFWFSIKKFQSLTKNKGWLIGKCTGRHVKRGCGVNRGKGKKDWGKGGKRIPRTHFPCLPGKKAALGPASHHSPGSKITKQTNKKMMTLLKTLPSENKHFQ